MQGTFTSEFQDRSKVSHSSCGISRPFVQQTERKQFSSYTACRFHPRCPLLFALMDAPGAMNSAIQASTFWVLDFYCFGYSDRYAEMRRPAESNQPLGQAQEISQQIECDARFICAQSVVPGISLIAHSGRTIGTAIFAIRNPEVVDQL